MTTELKIQIIFALTLAFELLGLYMIVIRTIAGLEYAYNRTEDIINREVQLFLKFKEQEKVSQQKQTQNEQSKSKKNELLLNIPFMERLSKEKRGG